MTDVHVLGGIRELRRLFVAVRSDTGERLSRPQHERPDREGRCILRRGRRGQSQTYQKHACAFHRASPNPRSALRASTSPNPNEQVLGATALVPGGHESPPVRLKGTALFSSASSMAAGSVMPCCISIAAMPATCGAAIDVPVTPIVPSRSKRGARYCEGGTTVGSNVSVKLKSNVC